MTSGAPGWRGRNRNGGYSSELSWVDVLRRKSSRLVLRKLSVNHIANSMNNMLLSRERVLDPAAETVLERRQQVAVLRHELCRVAFHPGEKRLVVDAATDRRHRLVSLG